MLSTFGIRKDATGVIGFDPAVLTGKVIYGTVGWGLATLTGYILTKQGK